MNVEAVTDPADLTATLISAESTVTVESNPDVLPGDYEFIVYDSSIVPDTANMSALLMVQHHLP